MIPYFTALSKALQQLLSGYDSNWLSQKKFLTIIEQAENQNPWFTQNNIRYALTQIATNLRADNLKQWLSAYPQITVPKQVKTIAVIMAGNIPLVGFHDMLTVLISGHKLIGKLSSKDAVLPKMIQQILININPEFKNKIFFTETQLKNFEAVIATGSTNSAQVFYQYFEKYPHIIRQNRNSVAIITGNETTEDLKKLGHDIFCYFGLGCRNISKIYIPENYPIENLTGYFSEFSYIRNHNKYMNNYDYQKAIFLMNDLSFLDGNFFLMQENNNLSSPISIIFYERYRNLNHLKLQLQTLQHKLQVVVSKENNNFGHTQQPNLWDYADGIDTLNFIL
ncbi:MAG TPA: acyl-CoA reductase, partial [Bacteroidales bacterium]|nr:acyl-CoA reductase [Bacteroidales bacterium]